MTQDANELGLSSHLYTSGGPSDNVSGETQSTYGWAYPFEDFYVVGGVSANGYGVILPPHIEDTPGVFELKNPYDNIKGIVE